MSLRPYPKTSDDPGLGHFIFYSPTTGGTKNTSSHRSKNDKADYPQQGGPQHVGTTRQALTAQTRNPSKSHDQGGL